MVVDGDRTSMSWLQLAAASSIWAIGVWAFDQIGFGMPFAIVTAIALVLTWGLGERRWSHETSAYSVFNKDQQELAGTLSARQIERELRGVDGPSSSTAAQQGETAFGGQGRSLHGVTVSDQTAQAEKEDFARKKRQLVKRFCLCLHITRSPSSTRFTFDSPFSGTRCSHEAERWCILNTVLAAALAPYAFAENRNTA
jgi:hypothetical protein